MGKRAVLPISFEWSPKIGVKDLPVLHGNQQTNVPGIYAVGDLADAPIIKVALNQGYEVARTIAAGLPTADESSDILDAVVVGAGPAGIGAAIALSEAGRRFVVLEREKAFATIQNFPKEKLIFSEPRDFETRCNLWFDDAQKEDLIERWEQALDERSLPIQQPEEVVSIVRQKGKQGELKGGGFKVETRVGPGGMTVAPRVKIPGGPRIAEGAKNVYRCRTVILATGRRGKPRSLDVPGEDLDKVTHILENPADYAGKKLLVVGGGDSGVEAACNCADAGAEVTISCRSRSFSRVKAKNRDRIHAYGEAGKVRVELESKPVEILEDRVRLSGPDGEFEVPNDAVLLQIGWDLPRRFLERIGLRMQGAMSATRVAWIASFALLTYCFYVLKSKKDFFPFGPGHPFEGTAAMLQVDLGFRQVDASFWGTVIYGLFILVFGVRAYRKYPQPTQKRRYLSLIGFQWLFLFGVPELIAPAIISVAEHVPGWLARPWKFYAISVPWPLSIWSAIDGPGWGAELGVETSVNIAWIIVGATVAFVLVPLYVWRQGERFCSYLCGCGGLAETLGDFWRHLSPRGETSYTAEWAGRVVFFAAIPVTVLILNDAWQLVASGALHDTAQFSQKWYGLMVDFWLASVVGVAFYPHLGNRVWCRFFCPLRAYMELLAKRFARITIVSNERCIGCGECTRYCQMGIQVQKFAQQRIDMDNSNSSCIQCGICVQVCPMEVLSVGKRNRSREEPPHWFAPERGL